MGDNNMNCIGIRVTPKTVYFSVIELTGDNKYHVLTVDQVNTPKSMDNPDRLSFLRTTFLSIIYEYNIKNACIRKIENIAKNINIDRANIEGVIQELISNCIVEKYASVDIQGLSKILKIRSSEVNTYLMGNSNIESIDNWKKYNKMERESILSSIAASSL